MSTDAYINVAYGAIVSQEQARQWEYNSPDPLLDLFEDTTTEDNSSQWILGKVLSRMHCRNHSLHECEDWIGVDKEDGFEAPIHLDNLITSYAHTLPKFYHYIQEEY